MDATIIQDRIIILERIIKTLHKYNLNFSFTIEIKPSFRTPFNIFIHTDSTEGSATTAETLNRGFCLDFVQQPCSTTSG